MAETISPQAQDAPRDREHLFFSAMAVLMTLVVFAGFSQTFFLRPLFPETAALAATEPVFYFHGALFTLWMALLIVQTSFIRAGAVARHMAVGRISVLLAVVMVIIGVHAGIVAAQRPGGFNGVPVPPLQFLIIPLGDMALFGGFFAAAFALRRRPRTHKRLMLLATMALLNAATARIVFTTPALGAVPFADFLMVDLFVIALAAWDFASMRRLHPATLWGGLALIGSQPLRLLISATPPWQAFASWLTGVSA